MRRQSAALVVLAGALLAGCGEERPELGVIGNVEGYTGGAAADEPRAAVVAGEVLSSGGTAADAAVALFFTLTVTYPIAASVGGGGVCITYDAATGIVESLEFLPRTPAGGGAVAVPGSVRAMAALHARYGRLRWARLLAPAEQIARFGHPVSRALTRSAATNFARIEVDDSLSQLLLKEGKLLSEGEGLAQVELAATLSALRTRGPGDFHAGMIARNYVEAAGRMGGALTLDDMRSYLPAWRETARLTLAKLTVHASAGPALGGMLVGEMWAMLTAGDRYRSTPEDERAHLFAEVSMRAYVDAASRRPAGVSQISAFRADALMTNYDANRHMAPDAMAPTTAPTTAPPGAPVGPAVAGSDGTTSFVVADRDGSAVACGLTMNAPFGVGRRDPLTGIIPARTRAAGSSEPYLGAVLVERHHVDELVLVAVASGGAAAPAAVMATALGVLFDGEPLASAIDAPRLAHVGSPDLVHYESGVEAETLVSLRERGHAAVRFDPLGFVNAAHCPQSPSGFVGECTFRADRRSFGLRVGR